MGDGWNGNVLALKQNNTVVGIFGNYFTSGFSAGPIYITVTSNIPVQVVVSTYGYNQYQMGFKIKAPNGTIIYQRTGGAKSHFYPDVVFTDFCPGTGCPINPYVKYRLYLYASWNYGWQGNVLVFQQNGTSIKTFTLTTGY